MLPEEKRTWKIIIIALLIAGAIFGFAQCGDSSWYTFHGEKINLWFIAVPLGIIFVAFCIWTYIANRPKKKKE